MAETKTQRQKTRDKNDQNKSSTLIANGDVVICGGNQLRQVNLRSTRCTFKKTTAKIAILIDVYLCFIVWQD